MAHAPSSRAPVGIGSSGLPAGRLVAVSRHGGGRAPTPVALAAGPLQERLLVEGMPVADLALGTRLRVGDTVVIELAGSRAAGLEPGPGAGEIVEGAAGTGVRAQVVTAGPIHAGDAIVVEAVLIPIEDALDLHPFKPAETLAIVEEYLARARAAGLDEVRIIHGRGRGVQRELVRRFLATSADVAGFGAAPPDRGGWGATVVWLRRLSGAPPA